MKFSKTKAKRITNMSLLLGSILISLFIAESLISLIDLEEKTNFEKLRWNHWSDKRWIRGYNDRYSFDKDVGFVKDSIIDSINKVPKKAKNETRILLLGDSVLEFGNVKDDLIEDINSSQITILNAGVMGYDPILELKFYKKHGYKFNPDIIIIVVNPNDFIGTPVIIKKSDGNWLAYDRRYLDSKVSIWLFQKSSIYRNIMLLLLSNEKEDLTKPVKDAQKGLLELSNLCMKTNITPVFVFMPLLSNNSYETNRRDEFIDETIFLNHFENNSIKLKNAFNQFPVEIISLDPYHTNSLGNKIMTNTITDFLKNNKII